MTLNSRKVRIILPEPLPDANGVPPSSQGGELPDVVAALSRRRRYRIAIRVAAVLGDVAMIIAGFAIGGAARYGNPLDEQALNTLAAILPIYLLIGTSQRAFVVSAIARARTGSLRACASLLLTIAFLGLVTFFLQVTGGVSRGVVGVGVVVSVGGIVLFRTWLAIYAHRLLGDVTINEVVIQDEVSAPVHSGSILLDAVRDGIALRLDSPEMLDRLGRCLQLADRVVVMCPPERRVRWASALKSSDVNAEIRASELDGVGALGLGHYNGGTTLKVASAPLALTDRLQKRLLDLMLVGAALPFLAVPMALVALAIKATSRGPVFFRQPRVGLGNRVFQIYKFRSMRMDAGDSSGGRSTSRNDDRITRVGAFIRRTSIDELPQIFNVLTGDMSIVGPRPHPLQSRAEDRLFWDIDGRYWHRHAVKPGITGLAQVRGFRGATEKEEDLVNRLQADLEYVSDWSIVRDLAIIISTFRVLVHENAF